MGIRSRKRINRINRINRKLHKNGKKLSYKGGKKLSYKGNKKLSYKGGKNKYKKDKKTKKRYKNQKGKGYTFGFTNPLGKEPSLVKYGMEYSPVYPGSKISGTSNNSCEVKFVKNMNGCNN